MKTRIPNLLNPQEEMEKQPGTIKTGKHLLVQESLVDLDKAINNFEDLCCLLKDQPIEARPKGIATDISWSDTWEALPNVLNGFRERIYKTTEYLKGILF